MRAPIVTGILLAACAMAQEYPKSNGFVNDFANQLPLEAVQSLEKKVRDYQRATGNEIGVAVVSSLNGQPIDEYSQGLFRAWGVGRYGQNNGVLFVWAPKERQIRIHVGRGLEGVLTNAETSRIVTRVRSLFRDGHYEAGVNAAVDGIIEVIGPNPAGSAAPPDSEAPTPAPAPAPEESGWGGFAIAMGVAVGLGAAMWLIVRQQRTSRWREEIPQQLAEADAAFGEAERKRSDAQMALSELRKDAPDDVWRRYDALLQEAPETLARLRSELDQIRLLPQGSYAELKTAHDRLRHRQVRMHSTVASLDEVRATLDTFRSRRDEAQQMLRDVPARLVRMEASGVPESAEGLLRAAADTYGQAQQESRLSPANWLLVYDLLSDVGACLDQIENPSRTRYRPVRYWGGQFDSPAVTAMEMMYISQMQSQGGSSDGGFDLGGGGGGGDSGGGGSGFDSGGGFGGGDSGGGGSSSDY